METLGPKGRIPGENTLRPIEIIMFLRLGDVKALLFWSWLWRRWTFYDNSLQKTKVPIFSSRGMQQLWGCCLVDRLQLLPFLICWYSGYGSLKKPEQDQRVGPQWPHKSQAQLNLFAFLHQREIWSMRRTRSWGVELKSFSLALSSNPVPLHTDYGRPAGESSQTGSIPSAPLAELPR